MSHSTLEDILKDGRHLYDIELSTIQALTGRFQQPGFKQLN